LLTLLLPGLECHTQFGLLTDETPRFSKRLHAVDECRAGRTKIQAKLFRRSDYPTGSEQKTREPKPKIGQSVFSDSKFPGKFEFDVLRPNFPGVSITYAWEIHLPSDSVRCDGAEGTGWPWLGRLG
jgi:hypothetical protein